MQQPPPLPTTDSLGRFFEWFASALGGALVVLVTFRTRLASMERDNADRKREIEAERAERVAEVDRLEHDAKEWRIRTERRQLAQLRISADIARAVNVDNRFTDRVLKMLADDDPPEEGFD